MMDCERPKVIVFSGTSISKKEILEILPNAIVMPPIKRGDLAKNVAEIYCIIDGYFHHTLSVSPAEISNSLKANKILMGAGSIGALRAVECRTVGMIGIGRIYNEYLAGTICDDDEVAVSVDPETHKQISDALIDVRFFLKTECFSNEVKQEIISRLKYLPFEERSLNDILESLASEGLITIDECTAAQKKFKNTELQKHMDARLAIIEAGRIAESFVEENVLTGSRNLPLEEAWKHAESMLETAGITRIADITGLANIGVPVHQSFRPESKYPITVFSGKGLTPMQSKVGAAMEAIESFVMEQATPDLIFSKSVKEMIAEGNSVEDVENVVLPAGIWLAEQQFDWVEMFNFKGGSSWFPKECVLMPCPGRQWPTNTNGIASGFDIEEAMLHGLFELIERDSLSLALVSKKAAPVHGCYLKHISVKRLTEAIKLAGFKVLIKDITGNLGVPTYYCLITGGTIRIACSGSGAHLDPIIALNRAITESIQSLTCYIAGSREDLSQKETRISQIDPHSAFYYWYTDLVESPSNQGKLYSTFKGSTSEFLRGVLQILDQAGMNAYWREMSDGTKPVKVVRMLVPGLESFVIDKAFIGKRLIEQQPILKGLLNKGVVR